MLTMVLRSLIFVIFVISGKYVAASEKIVVCYYGTWATYRPGLGKFDVSHINVDLCTHMVYAFVGIDYEGTVISLDPFLDLPDNWGKDNFGEFTRLKQKNASLKTILAVGGWNEGSAKYSIMAANATLRKNFIDSAIQMTLDHGFDGFDVDWEYPNRRDTVYGKADVDNFSQLLKEMREEFDKYGLLLTAAVYAVAEAASASYDIPKISKYLDYVHIMTYDMYGAWDPVTGHNAPLHKGEGDENAVRESLYTVDVAVEYWLRQGCPPEKLVLGVPFYGRTFTLTNANVTSVRARASGAGIAGTYTATSGFIGYNEFCVRLQTEAWNIRYDSLAKVPYAFLNRNWVSYDDAQSIMTKVNYSLSLDLAGIMLWSIETDDFHNSCGGGDFPLLRAINNALGRDTSGSATTQSTSTTTTVTASSTITSTSTTTSTTTAAPSTSSTNLPTTTLPSTTTAASSTTTVVPGTTSTTPSTTAAPNTTTETLSTTTVVSSTTTVASSTTTPSISTTTTSAASSTTSATTDISTICKEEGFAPNPVDCSSFYLCMIDLYANMTAIPFNCPPTLYWDQQNQICNYPRYTECNV